MRTGNDSFNARVARAAVRAIAGAILPYALAGAVQARAVPILVGSDAAECTTSTIQAAIDQADDVGGQQVILVTDDVAAGGYRENLRMSGLRDDLQLEIVGGLRSCADPTPTGKRTSVSGDGGTGSVLLIEGRVDLKLRGLRLVGGLSGFDWQGYGTVELADIEAGHNRQHGISALAIGGAAELDWSGDVEVSSNFSDGVYLWDAALTVRGDRNRIATNGGSGLLIDRSASADIGATGAVLHGNTGYGIVVSHYGAKSAPPTYLYSTDPANPLMISANGAGAIFQIASGSSHQLCLKNIALQNNNATAIQVDGPLAALDFNASACTFPSAADITCPPPHTFGQCNILAGNSALGKPLIAAVDGAHVGIHRVLIAGNSADSLLSASRAGMSTASNITVTTSVVAGNIANGNLFESLDSGILVIADSTVFQNGGSFTSSFAGTEATLLGATNTIIDQVQPLLALQGDPASARMMHVLARNDEGTKDGQHDILVGKPAYVDGLGRLEPTSPGVDYAPATGGLDFDGHARDVDLPEMPDARGPRDIGAFEVQAPVLDRLFADGFE